MCCCLCVAACGGDGGKVGPAAFAGGGSRSRQSGAAQPAGGGEEVGGLTSPVACSWHGPSICLMCHCRSCFWRKTLCSSLFDRKVEDLQFRVEEACITKGDLEVTRGYITCFSIKHLLSVLPAINLPLLRLMLSLWYSFVNYWQTRWLFYITQGFCRPQVSKCLKFQGPEF